MFLGVSSRCSCLTSSGTGFCLFSLAGLSAFGLACLGMERERSGSSNQQDATQHEETPTACMQRWALSFITTASPSCLVESEQTCCSVHRATDVVRVFQRSGCLPGLKENEKNTKMVCLLIGQTKGGWPMVERSMFFLYKIVSGLFNQFFFLVCS